MPSRGSSSILNKKEDHAKEKKTSP